ncbi:MAG: helix-turn-helix domain-containing protein [Patescibacteria group bacterium]|nr:helix-turn-helix domain-containing protein [Patescibacteria group bacterium]
MYKLGLSEKALDLYKAAIESGVTTVAHLAQVTGIKRPTAYMQLEELITAGLMEKVKINKKTYFKASDPKVLSDRLAEDKNLIEQLSIKYQEGLLHLGQPQARVLEGVSHIKELYKEVGEANSIRIWSNVGEIYHLFSDAYQKLAEQVRQNEINTREIIASGKASMRYAKYLKQIAGPTYSFRASTFKDIENDTIVFGNCVAIFRLHEKNIFAVRIEDSSIAKTFRAIFDMSWGGLK